MDKRVESIINVVKKWRLKTPFDHLCYKKEFIKLYSKLRKRCVKILEGENKKK